MNASRTFRHDTARLCSKLVARPRGRCAAAILAAASLGFAAAAAAATIAVPNGDFSSATNANAGAPIGGGLLTPSATGVAIGSSGPWTGSYAGAVGVVAPPQLAIDASTHVATIDGILGLNVLNSLVANSGSFDQVFPAGGNNEYFANKVYTLKVQVQTSQPLGVDLLGNGIVGSKLTATNGMSTTTVASSDTNPAVLTLLSGDQYELTLKYTTPAAGPPISRRIGVSLFSRPAGIASLSLLSTISFGNVTLVRAGTIPASVAVTIGSDSGSQTATVGESFAHPLSVTVVDADGDPVPGVSVTFGGPASGPGATMDSGNVVTGEDGVAQVDATANTQAGAYEVTAQVAGVDTPATFELTNDPGAPSAVAVIPPAPTTATVATAFAPLSVEITDQYGNSVSDGTMAVASAGTAANGASTQDTAVMAQTSGGVAQFDETANTIAGSYEIVVGAGSAMSAPIAMTNTAGAPSKIKPGVDGNLGESGSPQSATITTPFALPLAVLATDAYDNPVSGAEVTFTVPASGAGAHLDANPATTDANGIAAVGAVANATAGAYQITASVAGGSESTTFELTNTAATTTGIGGSPQTTVVLTEFGCALIAKVADANGPVAGVGVRFLAIPGMTGASALLSSIGGAENANPLQVDTDAQGAAAVVATGNAFAGEYVIEAGIPGSGQTTVYHLTNLAVGDPLFANGFEDPADTCPIAN